MSDESDENTQSSDDLEKQRAERLKVFEEVLQLLKPLSTKQQRRVLKMAAAFFDLDKPSYF